MGASAFDTVARTADEVLLGTDDRHLDFRASVLREDGRVVLSTVVRVHNRRGRLYWGLVRHVHPAVVKAMLARAARRLSRHSNAAHPEPGHDRRMTHTNGGFELPTWVDSIYAEPAGESYARVGNTKVWSGGIVGDSAAELVTMSTGTSTAAYVGIERMDVTLDGRKGTFVLTHVAQGDATGGSMTVAVVPGSGTGDLTGLTGAMQIARSPEGVHTWEFDYDLH